jgi:methylated-DNA-[protein]-cysteine S-methyltransferase
MMNFFTYQTPVGKLSIACEENHIVKVKLSDTLDHAVRKETPLIQEAYRQLIEYFEGKRKHFELPLKPKGTLFQQAVWNALCQIPYRKTKSYKEIAEIIGNHKACRAVGMANHRNPVMIIIPCHRVIGADGALTGYACGVDIKEQLLRLENIIYKPDSL